MTTNIFSVAPSQTTDAEFRAWGSAVSAALAAVGLVKTSDTGQINWTTVVKPTAGTFMGYEIWRFADTLQATAPIFLKFEFGAGTTATNLSIRLTVGKGSDGAGVITGTLLAATPVNAGSANATSSNWYMSSGDGSMIAIAPAPAQYTGLSNGTAWSMAVERSRNASGVATGVGAIVVVQSANIIPSTRVINYAGGNTITLQGFPATVPANVGLSSGGNIPLFPGIVSDGQGNFWQPRVMLIGVAVDIGILSQISVSGFGTYLPVTGLLSHDTAQQGTSRAAIWWQ